MTMHNQSSSRTCHWALGARLLAACVLGAAAAIVLMSCGSSGKGLIPLANAGPLQSDFEAVAQAAQTGGGDCTATTEAINKTEQDFAALPATIDPGLHRRLSEGISNLRERALALCTQPLAQTATTTTPRTTATTTTTSTTPTKTETTPPSTTPTSTTTTPTTPPAAPPNNGGGTAAPGESEHPGGEQGESGGVGPGGDGQGDGNGPGGGK